jgi:hypothetical protein
MAEPTERGYFVGNQDWPTGTSDLDLTEEQVFTVLDDLDRFHDGAVESFTRASDY